MLTFRPFRNADPPVLAALWQSCANRPGLKQPVSPELLEQLVFAKLYFDYDGLILAHDDGRPVGFAHAGFGPNESLDWISTETGVTCLLLIAADCDEDEVARGLLEHCERYLTGRGAKTLLGGGVGPINPFYVGLYGGADLPGVLDSNNVVRRAFEAAGYRPTERTVLMQCKLDGTNSGIDRRQIQLRRQMDVEVVVDSPTQSWWEACVFGEFELIRFYLKPRCGGPPVAAATFRDMSPGSSATIGRSMALIDISVDAEHRRGGLARFLLNDAFRWFLREGVLDVQLQTFESDETALAAFENFRFRRIGEGSVWRKE